MRPRRRFFMRVDPAPARAAVADLERMTAEDVLPADYIDPGEDHAFSPEVMDGECSAVSALRARREIVPASIANLGPGLDTLGVAVTFIFA